MRVEFSGQRLVREVRAGDWLHIDWRSYTYASQGRPSILNWIALLRYVAILVLIRLNGGGIAWTAHNFYPHDEGGFLNHRVGRRLMCSLPHLVLAHGPAAAAIEDEFGIPPTKLVTCRVGH